MSLPSQDLLGCYVLPGRVADARPAVTQALTAEKIGLGTVWLSEKWGTKDPGAILGAISSTTTSIRIGLGVTNFLTRHPLTLASMGLTLQSLSGGRFLFGVGRGEVPGSKWSDAGLPTQTNAVLKDHASITRRLWSGETVSYHGPGGDYPALALHRPLPDVPPPPILLGTYGRRTLQLAGRHFDGVILPAYLTPETVRRLAGVVKEAAADAGRDPAAVAVIATVITVADLPAEDERETVAGRAVQYFQSAYGDAVAAENGWDSEPILRLRQHPKFATLGNAAANLTFLRRELVDVSEVIPQEWLTASCAIGTAEACADRVREYLTAGADQIILHGSTAELLTTTVAAFNKEEHH
ncbi:TIGR03857 family LLM class F420-dependent oxidoreductase [Streptomyces yunnanensis]|uniref:Probable F420-dependent oxidoreductase, MSMEG_2249 family n=1 Tax=Streptomyces yunnanensis TaxID=156453 RepID=A0A9X8N913_9ACTN|nr:TIGR03857 family LLM class F420-dependent oxidoreductase [Streptomyces yunnanensis]SHN31063.1 probable F420-dependent oxidoreductase, MSMEG_2249 family [Streptomyces yunnanensis]